MSSFAAALAALMDERGLTGAALARRVPCDPAYISRLASGAQKPGRVITRKLDDILSAGGELVALAREARPFPVGAESVTSAQASRATSLALVRLDSAYGGNTVLPVAVQAFRSVAELTQRKRPGRDLLGAVAEAGEVAAWVAYDADDQDLSRRLAKQAICAAREAGDLDMELMLLSHVAMQDTYLHNPVPALKVSDAVLSGRLAPRARAVFELRRGRALAQLGDLKRGLSSIRQARVRVSGGIGPRDPWWAWWCDESEVAWHEGLAYADLGEWGRAVPLLERAVSMRLAARGSLALDHPARRARFNDQVHLLDALVRVRAWRETAEVLAVVEGSGKVVSSQRTVNLLDRVMKRIAKDAPPDVRAELIRTPAT